MSDNQKVTTTGNIRVQDVTFKRARKQSEVLKEIEGEDQTPKVQGITPVSLTVEQLIKYYSTLAEQESSPAMVKLYLATVRYLEQNTSLKSEVNLLKALSKKSEDEYSEEVKDLVEEE